SQLIRFSLAAPPLEQPNSCRCANFVKSFAVLSSQVSQSQSSSPSSSLQQISPAEALARRQFLQSAEGLLHQPKTSDSRQTYPATFLTALNSRLLECHR